MDFRCDRQRAGTPQGPKRVASLLEVPTSTDANVRWSPEHVEKMVMDKIRQATAGSSGFCLEAFRLFKPANGDEILPQDFKKSLERLLCAEFTETEARCLFDRYDLDRSGSLDIQEFIAALLSPPSQPKKLVNTTGMVFPAKRENPKKKSHRDLPLHRRIQRPWVPNKWFTVGKLSR